MTKIHGYHAHVYFTQETLEQAQTLCETATEQLSIKMGTMHTKPVGPHPVWSCQLSFPADRFGEVIPWLALNREGIVIFIHTLSGDDLLDHTKYAMWMGQMLPLNLEVFKSSNKD